MDRAIKVAVVFVVVAPWIVVLPILLCAGLLSVFPDHVEPGDPHEVLYAKDVLAVLWPMSMPTAIAAYAYVLFLVFVFVGTRKR